MTDPLESRHRFSVLSKSSRAAGTGTRGVRRGAYLLPSALTMGNLFCGYACIVHAMRGEFRSSAWPSCSTCSTAASRA